MEDFITLEDIIIMMLQDLERQDNKNIEFYRNTLGLMGIYDTENVAQH